MGPILVDGTEDFTYKYNPYSWNQEYNMIFIDNPIGTGLSYAVIINLYIMMNIKKLLSINKKIK